MNLGSLLPAPRPSHGAFALLRLALLVAILTPAVCAAELRPTHADVHYGPHERQVLDFYAAKSGQPTPLAIYIYGAGFTAGDKRRIPADDHDALLAAGISVAAINYRHISDAPLPGAFHDGARAVQYLRSRAAEWKIDKSRVAVWGGSAGAQISLYIGFHDNLADLKSADPVARESTRVTCVGTVNGQTNIDPEWMIKWIPGYTKPDRDVPALFGLKTHAELVPVLAAVAALPLLSADDPPVMMTYGMTPDDPLPADPKKITGWQVHHVMFGVKLKERMDAIGVEAVLKYPGAKPKYPSLIAFMIEKLGRK